MEDFENSKNRLIWVDLEMTDLNIDVGHIIEMACIVTDAELNIIAESPNIVIHHSDQVLNSMGEWQTNNFNLTGLTNESRASKVSLSETEQVMLEFVQAHTEPGQCPLAGNTVHEDKRFLIKYMRNFVQHLHYRIVDVSTVKELCKRWRPNVFNNAPKKKSAHRALEDIRESIEELRYYHRTIFA
jgi:oligoribonuclease